MRRRVSRPRLLLMLRPRRRRLRLDRLRRREVLEDRRGHIGRIMAEADESLHERSPARGRPARHRRLQGFKEGGAPPRLHRRRRGHRLAADPRLREPLDHPQLVVATSRHERHRPPLAAGTARAADAVHVVFGVAREVVVDDELEVVDVDAPRGHVGGHEQPEGRPLEALHDPRPLRLGQAAMQPFRRVAPRGQGFDELVHHPLRVAEDDAALHVVILEHPHERVELRMMADLVAQLIHQRRAISGPLGDADGLRVAGVPLHEGPDRR